jgi:hypothetical protein
MRKTINITKMMPMAIPREGFDYRSTKTELPQEMTPEVGYGISPPLQTREGQEMNLLVVGSKRRISSIRRIILCR